MASYRSAYLRRMQNSDEDNKSSFNYKHDSYLNVSLDARHVADTDDDKGDVQHFSSSMELLSLQRHESINSSSVVSSHHDHVILSRANEIKDDAEENTMGSDSSKRRSVNGSTQVVCEVLEEDHLSASDDNDYDAEVRDLSASYIQYQQSAAAPAITDESQYSSKNSTRAMSFDDDDTLPPPPPSLAMTKCAPLQRDFTQNCVSKEGRHSQVDESDWARRNQGRSMVY